MNGRGSAKRFARLVLVFAMGLKLAACAGPHHKAGPSHVEGDERFCEEGIRPGPDFFDANCYGGIGL